MSGEKSSAWSAVFAMALSVAMLIASEFMPVSLLTPMADSLLASEGQTGQAISISGLWAVVASLAVTTVIGRVNRKWVLLTLTTLMLLSLLLTAMADNFLMLMFARTLLGLCIGGYWALATAVIMRLVPSDKVSKALAVMYTGQASAVAFAAPIGSYLGGLIGWRGVFWVLVPWALISLLWQGYSLPSLPAQQKQSFTDFISLLKRTYFRRGIIAVMFTFSGAFAMYTYLRPFLEQVANVNVSELSLLLLLLGCAGFIGTWLAGRLANGKLLTVQLGVPVGMAAVTLGLLQGGDSIVLAGVLMACWGVLNSAMPVGWMAWVSQNVDDQPEAAGGLMVAAIQASILAGSAVGGWLLDQLSIEATFIGSALLSLLAIPLIGSGKPLEKSSNINSL